MRPVDLAREHGLSTQAVRNYEADGILPEAVRSPSGYRSYTPRHAQALRAFLALVPGHGHRTATAIMRAINRGAFEDAYRLIDASHAQLLDDRRVRHAVEAALRDLTPALASVDASGTGTGTRTGGGTDRGGGAGTGFAGRGDTFVGPLAGRLGIRPATLRQWERAGLVRPRRDPRTGYRVYGPADVRDAQVVHQLRRGNYRLEQIAPVLDQIRAAGGVEPLESMLGDWQDRLTARGRALITGAAALDAYLND